MGEILIITTKKDLEELLIEIISGFDNKVENINQQSDFINIDGLISFLADNGYVTKKSQVYKFTRENKIPFMKLGRKLLFNKKDIIAWLEEIRHNSSMKKERKNLIIMRHK